MSRARVVSLMGRVLANSCRCPAHATSTSSGAALRVAGQCAGKSDAAEATLKEYAVEMACSNIRYGAGVTREVGMDCVNLGARNVMLITDPYLAQLPPFRKVADALTKAKVPFKVFAESRVEPTDVSFKQAIDFARAGNFDCYVAVGGGSVIDTAKAANLYASDPNADFLDYVNAPIGRGKSVTATLRPLIAIPTTAGTGSETTGVAVFDLVSMRAKAGIAHRALRPTLGLVDPDHAMSMSSRVAAYSGFDVLCHALESYTALPYTERSPRPTNPIARPAYQGSNPISDVWSRHALTIVQKYFRRAVRDPEDREARSNMHLASAFAGVGFGNAGVHLCHGMSYPISGLGKTYTSPGYPDTHSLIPHGLSVVITSPAVFAYTAPACPERHLESAALLGADTRGRSQADAGRVLADTMRGYMQDLDVPNGLTALGFRASDLDDLVAGVLPQKRVTQLSPRVTDDLARDLAAVYQDSFQVY